MPAHTSGARRVYMRKMIFGLLTGRKTDRTATLGRVKKTRPNGCSYIINPYSHRNLMLTVVADQPVTPPISSLMIFTFFSPHNSLAFFIASILSVPCVIPQLLASVIYISFSLYFTMPDDAQPVIVIAINKTRAIFFISQHLSFWIH